MKNQFAVIVPEQFGNLNVTIFGTNNNVAEVTEKHLVTSIDNAKAVIRHKALSFADKMKLNRPSITIGINEESLEGNGKLQGHISFGEECKYDGTWELQM
jgi:hypothetical protein